jgi:voltage-gated potassium channel
MKRFELLMIVLIILSVLFMILETLPEFEHLRQVFMNIDRVFLLVFIFEYLVRIVEAERRRDYVFSLYGIIDLLAILPGFLHAAAGLRVIRLVRLLRILRLLKLARYTDAVDRFRLALTEIREELVLFSATATVFTIFFSFLIYELERHENPHYYSSVPATLWWAVISLTSVGYGDGHPQTAPGKILTVVMLLLGMGIVAVPTALLASALGKVRREEDG